MTPFTLHDDCAFYLMACCLEGDLFRILSPALRFLSANFFLMELVI